MRWLTVDEIPRYDFCPADDAILQKLMAGKEPKAPGVRESCR